LLLAHVSAPVSLPVDDTGGAAAFGLLLTGAASHFRKSHAKWALQPAFFVRSTILARRRKNKRQFFDEDDSSESSEKQGSSEKTSVFSSDLREQIETWAEEAAQASDLDLYDVELVSHGRWIIRVYVDNPIPVRQQIEKGEGITAGECAEVSRYLEAYLDASEAIPEKYVLEVSSPGIERELKKPRHLHQSVGEKVQLVVRKQVASRNKVIGELLAFEDGTLTVRLEDEGEQVDIDWANVKEARLKYDFDF
jgi:ribosome maturation factor RimP